MDEFFNVTSEDWNHPAMEDIMRSLSPERLSTFEGARAPQVSLQDWGQQVMQNLGSFRQEIIAMHQMILSQNKKIEELEKIHREELRAAIQTLKVELEDSLRRQSNDLEMLGSNVAELYSKNE